MKRNFKKFFRRGQALVWYGLFAPLLFLILGVVMDLGWYYLNVSRLQNAADAAVIAGAMAYADELSDNATTTTTTTTKTTKTYSYEKLVDTFSGTFKEPSEKSKDDAKEYVVKNLGTETDDKKINDKWSKGGDPTVTPTYSVYEDDDKFYYVVNLTENIEHLFMPGWFEPMEAPVVAVALISTGSSIEKFIKELTELLEKAKNENVIIGNWEVQNKHKNGKNGGGGTVKTTDLNIIDPKTGEKVQFLDSEGNERKEVTKYEASFGNPVYSDAWNHFQDFYNHYYLGDFYRKENVVVKDDVLFEEDPNGENIIDRNGTKGTITSYGKGKYGESSSVAATSASINTDKNNLAYNPGQSSTLKTHQDGITEKDTVGLPYTWKRLDSINIDFRIENTLSGKWISEDKNVIEDWDLELGFDDVKTANDKFETSGGEEVNRIRHQDVKRLRIHTSVNFEAPYPVRPDVDTEAEPDVLWGRIESEPILYHPDIMDRAYGVLKSGITSAGLNSVNQIILNFNQSNYNTSSQKYRPVIIFYDGPETYSIYSWYDTKNKFVRKSMPVIVNLNAPYCAILYMPNSPVVVIGDYKNEFKGFIMAKSYMRLKDDSDFIAAEDYLRENMGLEGDELTEAIYAHAYRYFNDPRRQYEYNRKVKADGTIGYQDVGQTDPNKYSSMVKKDTDAYRLKIYYDKNDTETDLDKKKRYYKMYGKKSGECPNEFTVKVNNKDYTCFKDDNGMQYIKPVEENGIDMYVDEHGDIQFENLSSPPTDCGTYDTFGRTDFTTHNYHLDESSATNMLLSGK